MSRQCASSQLTWAVHTHRWRVCSTPSTPQYLYLASHCCSPCCTDEDDDGRYAQDEYGEQPFHDHGYEDLADAASGKGAFDVMLTTYTLFERVGASNR